MKRDLFLFILLALLSGCSLLKMGTKEQHQQVSDQQLGNAVSESVNALLDEYWLSDFLVQHNERPILITSSFTNPTDVAIDMTALYNKVEMSLIESGQVRVVKSNQNQRDTQPTKLAKGKSVDYVLSVNFEEKQDTTPPILIIQLSLWNERSISPLSIVSKEIN